MPSRTVTFDFAFAAATRAGVARSITLVAPKDLEERDRLRRLDAENFWVSAVEVLGNSEVAFIVDDDDAAGPAIALTPDVWASLRRHRGSVQRIVDEFAALIGL